MRTELHPVKQTMKYKRSIHTGMGHVFFAMQIDGKTVFVDPQYPAADCEQYFKRYVKGGLYVIRVDNLQPSERITDCCKSGDE